MATEKLITEIIVKGDKKANKQVDGLDKNIGSLAKNFAVAGVAAIALTKSIKFMGESAKLLREDNKEFSKLQAIIKATGGSAGLTATQMGKYANEIQSATGVSNTLLLKTQGMLATFKNISGATFKRATQALVDMSAVQGELTGNTIGLGKALNDPIKGVTSLTRVGVQFTDQQKEQIKALQESGDLLGAQNIILKELEGQFKGAAAGSVQNTELLSAAWDDFRKRLAKDVEPAIQRVSGALANLISIPVGVQIKREQTEFNVLVDILKDVNTNTSTRTEAIRTLQENYPSYIGNIDLEKASLDELLKVQKLSNEEFEKTINQKVDEFFINKTKKAITLTNSEILKLNYTLRALEDQNINSGKSFVLVNSQLTNAKNNLVKLQDELRNLENRDSASDSYTAWAEAFSSAGSSQKLFIEPPSVVIRPKAIEFDMSNYEEVLASSINTLSDIELDDLSILNELADIPLTIDVTELEELPTALDNVKSKMNEISNTFNSVFGAASGALSAYGNMWKAEMDNELAALKHTDEYANATADERVIMEQEITDKYKDEKKKQWAIEKAFNISKSIMDTASAVIEALPNVILASAIGILGAAQTAFIASTPAPAFAKGTTNFAGGMALVGEEGPELVNLPGGSDVITNSRTNSLLNNDNMLIAEIRELRNALAKQPQYKITSIDDVTLNKRNEAGGLKRRTLNAK